MTHIATLVLATAVAGEAPESNPAAIEAPSVETTAAPTVVEAAPAPVAEVAAPVVVAPHHEPPAPAAVTAAFGEGVNFASPDGRLTLQMRGRMQIRFTETVQGESHAEEFVARRIRLQLKGNFFRKDLEYTFQYGFSPLDVESDLPLPLRDAYFTWTPVKPFGIRAGQMKVPYGVQRRTSSSALQFPDRSTVQGEYNLDRDVGVYAFSEDALASGGHVGWYAGVFGGDGRNRTSSAPGVLSVGRLILRPFGKFDDLSEGDFDRSTTPRIALGLSGAYPDNTNRPRVTTQTPYTKARFSYTHLGADLTAKWRGLSLVSEWFDRRANSNEFEVSAATADKAAVIEYSRPGWGFFAQAGYLLPVGADVELVARYGQLHPTGTDAKQTQDTETGGGINWYFQKHDFKLQADVFRYDSAGSTDPRWQGRLQSQLFF